MERMKVLREMLNKVDKEIGDTGQHAFFIPILQDRRKWLLDEILRLQIKTFKQ